MSKALAKALSRRYVASRNIEEVLLRDYPDGVDVTWRRNGTHHGVVLDHGHEDRIKVRNYGTDKEYWIYAYCIVDAM